MKKIPYVPKKFMLIAVGALLLAGVGTSVWYVMREKPAPESADRVVLKPTQAEVEIGDVMSRAESLANQGDVSGGLAQYDTAIAAVGNEPSRQQLFISKAYFAMQNKSLAEAEAAAKKADAINRTQGTLAALADIYKAMGNKFEAIKYYQLAIDAATSSDGPLDGRHVPRWQRTILELNKG